MLESNFQGKLIKKIKERFKNQPIEILKNDPNYIQGFPDLTILFERGWVVLECKKDDKSKHQPNQDYYVNKLNKMQYSRFVDCNNEETVLNEMESIFKS